MSDPQSTASHTKKRRRAVVERTSSEYAKTFPAEAFKDLFGPSTEEETNMMEFGVSLKITRKRATKDNTMVLGLEFDGRAPNPQRVDVSLRTTITRDGDGIYVRTACVPWNPAKSNEFSFGTVYGPKMARRIKSGDVITETIIFTLTETYESDESICVVCFDRNRQTTVRTCGHYALCTACALNLSMCPICRTPYEPDTDLITTFSA